MHWGYFISCFVVCLFGGWGLQISSSPKGDFLLAGVNISCEMEQQIVKSQRQRRAPVPFSPAAVAVRRRSSDKSDMHVNYALNKTKAVQKKAIMSLNEQSVSIECKSDLCWCL